ncbi:MAG TPA: hypothetical protein VFO91_17015 [Anaerolineales bacterium]|nr:hypothetical protein [Anaerolineales bacterium]
MNASPDHIVGTQTIVNISINVVAEASIPNFQPVMSLFSATDATTMPVQMDMPNG